MYKVELVVVGDYNDGDNIERRQEVDLDEELIKDDIRWVGCPDVTYRELLHAVAKAIKTDLKGQHNWWREEFDSPSAAVNLVVATLKHLTGFVIDTDKHEELDIIQDFLCEFISDEGTQNDLNKDGTYFNWIGKHGDCFEDYHEPELVYLVLRQLAVVYNLLDRYIVPFGNDYCTGVHTIDQIYTKPIADRTVFL